MDRALRIDSAAFSGPMVRIVTSASLPAARCASASCRPSSMAYSSSSLIRPSTDARSSVPSASLSLRSAQVSGTCLTNTTMFIDSTDLPWLLRHTACQTASRRPPPGPRASCYSLVTLSAKTGVTTVSRNGKVPATVTSAPRVPGERELSGNMPRGGGPVASGHRRRNRISRAHPCRLPGGPRPRGAGDRRRRGQDRQGRPGARSRSSSPAWNRCCGRTWTPAGSGSPCRSPRSPRSVTSTSCAWGRRRARPAGPTSARSTRRPHPWPRT